MWSGRKLGRVAALTQHAPSAASTVRTPAPMHTQPAQLPHRGLVMNSVLACWLLVSCARERLKSHT